MARPGHVFSKAQLIDQLYGLNDFPTENTIEAYIRRLRNIVGDQVIVTKRGQGYVFEHKSS